MSQAVRDAVVAQYAKTLKLPAMVREYPALARQAREEGWAYEDFLRDLLEAEVQSRDRRACERRLKEADFPEFKTLEQIDWQALSGVSRPKVLELSACDYLDRAEDIIFAGPIGTGKTHLAIALGVEATRRRYRVAFHRAADLVRLVLEARDERQLGRLHNRLSKVHLLIVDELGFVPFDRAGGELLFNLLADRYERRSTMVTTNLSFAEWAEVFGDEKMTTALLDRLSHHAHILTTQGASYRARKRKEQAR